MKKRNTGKGLFKGILAVLMFVFMCGVFSGRPVAAATVETNGSIYTTKTTGRWPDVKTAIYRQKKGGAKKKLITVSGYATPCFEYGNYLYYEKDRYDDPQTIDFWGLNLKTCKTARLRKAASVRARYGRYVLLMPNSGAVMDLPCYVYNVATRKASLLTKYCLEADISNKKIYYAEVVGGYRGSKTKVKVRTCSLTGGSKKTITPYFYADYCTKMNSKYVEYRRGNYTYRYTYATKKTTRVS